VPEGPAPGRGVLVAYNGRRESDYALQVFRASGLDFGEDVHILSMDVDANWASRCAQHAAEYLQLHEIRARAWAVDQPQSIARAILDEVRRRNVRLLVMGAYGRSTLREMLLGSITDTVLQECLVPVFLCH